MHCTVSVAEQMAEPVLPVKVPVYVVVCEGETVVEPEVSTGPMPVMEAVSAPVEDQVSTEPEGGGGGGGAAAASWERRVSARVSVSGSSVIEQVGG